jgi:serine phosphatase RsbU (regulator of sigma subunit)
MCVVDLVEEGRLEQVAFAPRDERRRHLYDRRAELLAEAGPDHPVVVALRTAQTQHVVDPPPGSVADEELVVPLIYHGTALGAVSLARRRGDPSFSGEDIDVIEAVARHVSAAVSAERLLEEHRNVSGLLQRTLLPRELPAIPGIRVATWYECGEAEMEVGGDFYDVVQRPDGSWLLVIGDVCGRGPAAAAMTGVVRHTLRGLAAHDIGLAEAVAQLNRRIAGEPSFDDFVTLAVVGVEARAEGPMLHTTLAGHPPPMVVAGDGGVSTVGHLGAALGISADSEYAVDDRALAPGDALLLYTDGLTEAHGAKTRFDHVALAALLGDCAGLAADDIVARVQRGLVACEGPTVTDDVAVMAAQVAG